MAKGPTWMLTVAYYDLDRQYHYQRWTENGETAVDAYLAAIDAHQEVWEEAQKKGPDAERMNAYALKYSQAILIGAWKLTDKQAKRADDEGW